MDGMLPPDGVCWEDDGMEDRVVLPQGELSRRLALLGRSLRGFADELGEDVNTLRRWDGGARMRRDVLDWIEREEAHRQLNPPPYRDGPAGRGRRPTKQLRRPPGVRAAYEAVEAAAAAAAEAVKAAAVAPALSRKREVPAAVAPAVVAPASAPAVASQKSEGGQLAPLSEDPAAMLRGVFSVPQVELPPALGPAPAEGMTPERWRLIADWLCWGAREFASRLGNPALAREYRRWSSGRSYIHPQVQPWVEELGAVAASRPAEVVLWHRALVEFQRRREEVQHQMNLVKLWLEELGALVASEGSEGDGAVMVPDEPVEAGAVVDLGGVEDRRWRRTLVGFYRGRDAIMRRMDLVEEELMRLRPAEDDRCEEMLDEVVRRMPDRLRSRKAPVARAEVEPDPKRPMTLDEIL